MTLSALFVVIKSSDSGFPRSSFNARLNNGTLPYAVQIDKRNAAPQEAFCLLPERTKNPKKAQKKQ